MEAKIIRPVDVYLDNYSKSHQNPANKLIHCICIPLVIFSLLGLAWAIPFPYIKFLGRYNGYFNWASFLIAFGVYYYYKLSPQLSYIMLLILFGLSFGIMELADWQKTGGPVLWQVCLVMLVLSLAGLSIGNRMENKKQSFSSSLVSLPIGPAWLLHFILKRFSIRY